MKKLKQKSKVYKIFGLLSIILLLAFAISNITSRNHANAACSGTGTYGVDSIALNNVPAGTYNVWTRVMIPSSSVNTIMLEVDGGNCYNVGGNSSLPTGSWQWVDYQNGATSTPIQVTFSTTGNHTFKFISDQGAGIGVDEVLLVSPSDSCQPPTSTGSNCETVTGNPTVSLAASPTTVTQGQAVTLTATASDSVSITKVDFYDGSTLLGTDTASPYTYTWNTTTSTTTGSHSLTAKVTDSSNATATSSAVNVTVNTATQAPTISLTANPTTVTQGQATTLSATATDSNTITKVDFYDGSTLLGTDTTSPYSYTWTTSTSTTTGTHSITAKLTDSTNATATSSAVSVTVNAATQTGVTVPFYMQTGGPGFTDSSGIVWNADKYYTMDNTQGSTSGLSTGGDGSACTTSLANENCTTHAISGTTNQPIYQYERWGDFHYDIPIANGSYTVILKFAEINPSSGTRVFNVSMQGSSVLSNFNIAAQAGNYAADDQSFPVSVTNGDLNIALTTVSNSAKLDGIEILPKDTTAPTVSLTSPISGATVAGTVNLGASASDNVGVSKVVFSVDGATIGQTSTSPYTYPWNSTSVANGSHIITATAYDAAGNNSAASVNVTVQNGDTTKPSAPTNLTSTASSYNNVNLSWGSSTDNVGVTGYYILSSTDGVNYTTINQVNGSTTTYSDSSVSPSTSYTYEVKAFDAAGNVSSPSTPSTVTTPSAPDTTKPSTPTNLSATAVSSSQINLSWTASTDNIGVTGYKVYRSTGSGSTSFAQIGTVTTNLSSPGYADTGLSATTTYNYYVVAYDAASNQSTQSSTATATTQQAVTTATLEGTVTSSATGQPIPGVYVYASSTSGHGKHATTTIIASTYTNSLGQYVLSGINPNTSYKYYFVASGYSNKSYTLTLPAAITILNVSM